MRLKNVTLLLCVLAAGSPSAAMPFGGGEAAWRDTLVQVPPRFRADWLKARELDDPFVLGTIKPESSGLRLVGKYGRGPSREVTGQDSLVFLSNGSEVAVLNAADPGNPVLLFEIQARSIVVQAIVSGAVLYIGDYAEVSIWDIADPSNPTRLSTIPYGVGDFAVSDSLLAFTNQGAFRVFSVADPASPYELGAMADSGTVRAASGSSFVLSSDQDIIYVVDCASPTQPTRRGSYTGYAFGLTARGSICCAAVYWSTDVDHFRFDVLDISNPDSLRRIGYLDDVGGYDIHLEDSLALVSGYQSGGFEFALVDMSDSTAPVLLGECMTAGDNDGVWSRLAAGRAYVADRFRGLAVVDIGDPVHPAVDTSLYRGGSSVDVVVKGGLACVACDGYGMVLVDVSDPALPAQLGALDSTRKLVTRAVAVGDSFAYMGYSPSLGDLHSIDITDPSSPARAGGLDLFNWPEDMVLRDSYVYCAEARRFQVVNVARPREPELVGNCVDADYTWDLDLEANLAAVAHTISLSLVDVVQPSSPQVVGSWSGDVSGVDIVDTIAYCTASYTGFVALSVADPAHPYVLDSLHLTDTLWWNDVVVVDSLAFVGGESVWVVDVSNPRDLRLVPGASWTPPYLVRRLEYSTPYLYAACYDAGVSILESLPVSIGEEAARPGSLMGAGRLRPNPTRGNVVVRGGPSCERAVLRDALGRTVGRLTSRSGVHEMNAAELRPGLYFVELRYSDGHREVEKLIKQ